MPRPPMREQAVRAAGWLLQGRTPKQAAQLAELSDRTLLRWRHREEWPAILKEARSRWLDSLVADARDALAHAMVTRDKEGNVIRSDGRLALSVLERLEEALAPAPQAIELRALLSKLDPAQLPDEVIDQLSRGKNVLGILLGMLNTGAPVMPRLSPGTDGEIVVDVDSVPEGDA